MFSDSDNLDTKKDSRYNGTAIENTHGGINNAETTEGNLDNNRDGRWGETKYAEAQMARSTKDVSMADRNSNKSRRFSTGSRRTILDTDSEGIRIDIKTAEMISETSVIDGKGHLIALYHSTNAIFDKFSKGDIGFHFGDKTQAEKRAKDKGYKNPRFIRAYLNTKKRYKLPKKKESLSPIKQTLLKNSLMCARKTDLFRDSRSSSTWILMAITSTQKDTTSSS